MSELELTYDEPGLFYNDPCYMYDGAGIWNASVIYDQALLGYDDPAFSYDGVTLCPVTPIPPESPTPKPIATTYPSYWKGIGGRYERKKPKNFLSVAVTSKCLAINGCDVDFSVCADEIRFAGEEEPTEVRARVQGAPREALDDLLVAASLLDGPTLEEPEEDNLEVSEETLLEEGEEFTVHGRFQVEEEDETNLFFVEATILTGSNQDMTLSCLPITKNLDGENEESLVIEAAVEQNEREDDPEDAS